MLQIEEYDGRHYPKFFCDTCGREITDAERAVAVFPYFCDDATRYPLSRYPLYFAHQNPVYGGCHDELADRLKKETGCHAGWHHLPYYLSLAVHNAGMSAKDVSKILSRPD